MKREAIIIVTPNYPKNPLPGAEQDAKDWISFLPAAEGGAWKEHEIHILRDPSRAVVDIWLKHSRQAGPDFALLAFSGHGEVVKTTYSQENRIYLNPQEYLTENGFSVGCDRELVILDSCRELRVEPEAVKKSAVLTFSEALATRAESRLAAARELFDASIAATPTGRTFVYSCSVNETAADQPSFTRILVGEGERLAHAATTRRCLSIREAFDATASVIRTTFRQKQTPIYDGGRRLTHLPFSVSV